MPRPHRLARWTFLALACVAIVAVGMIPRGVVRAIEASQRADEIPVQADDVRAHAPDSHEDTLPGVRARVAREEQDPALDPPDVALAVDAAPSPHDVTGVAASLRDGPRGVPQPTAGPAGSRAPPRLI